jgi:hypothetical protein
MIALLSCSKDVLETSKKAVWNNIPEQQEEIDFQILEENGDQLEV